MVDEVRAAPGDAILEVDDDAYSARGIPRTIDGERMVLTFSATTVTVQHRGTSSTAAWHGEVHLGDPATAGARSSLHFDSTDRWVVQRIVPPEGEPTAEPTTYLFELP